MTLAPYVTFLGVPLNPWTMEETLRVIEQRLDAGVFTQHVVVNVAKLVTMQRDDSLREAVLSCDIINVDGMGIVWGARFLGLNVPARVAGIDLFLNLIRLAASRAELVFFLGSKPDVLESAISNLQKRFPALKIAGAHHGYFWGEEEETVEKIRKSGARLLFVGIASPMKEQFIQRHRERLGVKFAMGVGGSFDIMAGKTKRAPAWMQHAGLEWFYRLLQEPRRMAKRYLTTNSKYAWMILRDKLFKRPSI